MFFLFMSEDNVIYGQQDFSLPHDVVQLPSGGKFYKSKKKSVKVGYLTAADENILMGGNPDELIINLLRNKVYEPDLRPEEMLNGDIEAILIWLRNTSFGPEYNVNVLDPKTGNRFPTVISLEALDYKKTEFEADENGYFTTTLPKSQKKVKLKPLKYREMIELQKISESYPVGRTVPTITSRLERQIVEIEGNSDPGFISKAIQSMPIMDSKYIRRFMKENEPGIELIRTVITPSGDKVEVEINFGVEFFRVFY